MKNPATNKNTTTALRSLDALRKAGLMASQGKATDAALEKISRRYAVALTPYLARRLKEGAPGLARQYLPDVREAQENAIERNDPIGDSAHSPCSGIIHRYPDRALLMPVAVCAAYCRFCFRRARIGPGSGALAKDELARALAYLHSRPQIREVILSGGDPLILAPRRLRAILEAVAAIPHVEVLRIHSRMPVADPERINDALLKVLGGIDKALYLAVHCNHAEELDAQAQRACLRLARAGVALLGQSVLLKGVNDNLKALEALLRAMIRCRIKPYYLHHPDLAPGSGHFRVSVARGRRLVDALRGRLSGLCQPLYVLDIPGGHGKTPLAAPWAECLASETGSATERWRIRDWQGKKHVYPPPASPRKAAMARRKKRRTI